MERSKVVCKRCARCCTRWFAGVHVVQEVCTGKSGGRRRKKMMKKMQDGVRKMARCKVVCKRCASCARWYARCKYAVEDEMNLCILSEGKRMLEPNSDIFGEFRRQRHRVLGLFLLLTVCLFTICIIGWSCSSRV